jgi:protein MpaA
MSADPPSSPAPFPSLDPADFGLEFDSEAMRHGFSPALLGDFFGVTLRAYTRSGAGAHRRPRIYLSAGIHGDEPAAPPALLELLRRGCLDDRADWYLVPLLNPSGFRAATRTNADGLDLNRDYRLPRSAEITAHVSWLRDQPPFDVSFCLHEDYEATGFYLYELNPDSRPSLAPTLLSAAAALGPIDQSPVLDGRPASEPGIVRPADDPLLRDAWPEALYLHEHHTRLGYTLETASSQHLAVRTATHCAAIEAAVAALLQLPGLLE